ncbi:DUF5677 domain-containing protein [Niabella sp. 22666]|uniref:DUF5677 domain-containing protein n=1 Tax=Niabella sp. 22666 TaxID=3453954 RepID=UPI003F860643
MLQPNSTILKREIDKDTDEKLQYLSDGLSRAVNFGTHLLQSGYEKCKGDEDLPVILFFRSLLDNADAITTLIRNSVIDACYPLLRAIFENLISFEYLFESGEKEKDRAMGYMVWNHEENRKLLRRSDDSTKQHQVLKEKCQRDKVLKGQAPKVIQSDLYDHRGSNRIYDVPKYKRAKVEYDRVISGKRYIKWYQLYDGPRNLAELAERAGYPALYESYYGIWSLSTHGSPIVQSKIFQDADGYATMIPMRSTNETLKVTHYCLNICIAAFESFVAKRAPERYYDLLNWEDAIRPFNLSLRT